MREDPAKYLEEVWQVYDFDDETGLDLLYDLIEDLFRQNRFDFCNEILKSIDISKLNDELLIGLLVVTLPEKLKLPFRSSFIEKVKDQLQVSYEDPLLKGLK